MRWTTALSCDPNPEVAAGEVSCRIAAEFNDGHPPDVLFVFVSPQYAPAVEAMAETLRMDLRPRHLLGCTAAGIVGGGKEVEDGLALAVSAARLPGVRIHPFHLHESSMPDLDTSPRAWEEAVGVRRADEPQFVVLSDPFSIRTDDALGGLDYAFPNAPKAGGLSSGARGRGGNMLFLDDRVLREGMVGLALMGNLRLETLVAQGCRPIGKPLTVTKCHKNLLMQLDGRKPMECIAEIYEHGSEDEQRLIRTALFIGLVMDPLAAKEPRAGDFLIRNILGRDLHTDGLYVNAMLRDGMMVQFHVRDARTAAEDLEEVLRSYSRGLLQEGHGDSVPRPPAGALLFSCLGRGKHMYGKPDHDSTMFRQIVGEVPLSGFFCNGEIGPVGATTYLHGFTSCFGIIRPKT
ncbi:MAG: FIST C-terminal domain-containing protein [Planctomycetota bacterium]|nr:FIST C-terminal domain-containing protein [Planctomycetota bacterium]